MINVKLRGPELNKNKIRKTKNKKVNHYTNAK